MLHGKFPALRLGEVRVVAERGDEGVQASSVVAN